MMRSVLRDGSTCAAVARIQLSSRTCKVEFWDNRLQRGQLSAGPAEFLAIV